MHVLDLIMYIATCCVIWWLMKKFSNEEWTHGLGGVRGTFIMALYSIAYLIVFCIYPDLNWIDIFNGVYKINFQGWFKW